MMQFFGLTLGILGVWRITHLLHAENGPWDLLDQLRKLVKADLWNGLFGCFYCLSLWVAVPFTFLLAKDWKERLLFWPALSAGAILVERLTSRESATPHATYFEEPVAHSEEAEENHDVFVRKDESDLTSDIEAERGWHVRNQ
jgi:hypothetical protein